MHDSFQMTQLIIMVLQLFPMSTSVLPGVHNEYKHKGVKVGSAHTNNCIWYISHARHVTILRIPEFMAKLCRRLVCRETACLLTSNSSHATYRF